jgi:hypothetical protein
VLLSDREWEHLDQLDLVVEKMSLFSFHFIYYDSAPRYNIIPFLLDMIKRLGSTNKQP